MTAHLLFFNVFSEKDPHLNAAEYVKILDFDFFAVSFYM